LWRLVLLPASVVSHGIPGQSAYARADGSPGQGRSGLVADHGTGQRSQERTTTRIRRSAVAGVGIVGTTRQGQSANQNKH
jgi:hypothetical protein